MILTDCLEAVTKAAGRELSKSEIKELSAQLERRTKAKQAATTALSFEEAALQAADDIGRDATALAAVEKRNAAKNLKLLNDHTTFIANSFADEPALGMKSMLTGSQRTRFSSRRSVAAEQEQLRGKYLGGFLADIERTGHLPLLASGSMDLEIARSLREINSEVPKLDGLPKEAVEIAQVMNKWQEAARLDANKAGAWVGKLPGYIVRQTHDMWRISAAGFEKWRAQILPDLDLPRMRVETDNIDDYLHEVYVGVSTGQHLKNTPDAKAGAFKGPANLAKKLSSERVLHFKDADGWTRYNTAFGSGNLRETFFQGLRSAADKTGLLRTMGTNPTAHFDQIVEKVAEGLRKDPEKLTAFMKTVRDGGKVRNRLLMVDGSLNIPVNAMMARVASGVQAVESMAKLGGSTLSSVTDIPVYASEMRYQGRGFLSGMAEAVGSLFKGLPEGDQREILSSLGVVFDSMIGDISRFGAHDDALPGQLAKLQQTYFKLNLQTPWTDRLLSSAALSMSHDLGQHMGTAFAKLRPETARVLSLYGIGEKEWRALNTVDARVAEDGRAYLTPEHAQQIPDSAIGSSAGTERLAARERAAYRDELESKLRTFFTDRTRTAVLHPDAETMSILKQGTRRGTPLGVAAGFIGQFKSFSIGYVQKIIGREIYGRGSDSLLQAMRNGNGEMLGLANIILWSTIFGYGAMSAKDALKGKTPRDPNDHKTWLAAMTQGGGAGIYGDFLFGESNRMGGGLLGTLAGPTASTAQDVYDLYQRAKAGDDVAAAGVKTMVNNTPFANLFWTRPVLDYLVLYRMQEALNPGYTRRLEVRTERENNQTFWLSPSEAVQ